MKPEERIRIALPAPASRIPLTTHCRGTLIASSLRSLRDRGLHERYVAKLDPRHRDTILLAIASSWLEMTASVAHYEACDQLGLTPDEQMEIGMNVSHSVSETFLRTVLRLVGSAGATPWLGLEQFGRIHERLFLGGAATIIEVGPKDARVEVHGLPLSHIPYFRNGFRGVIRAGCELFCRRAYVTAIPKLCTATTLGFRAMWA